MSTTEQTGVEMIAAERQRVIAVEGYTPEHDAGHAVALARAAACYALNARDRMDHLGDAKSDEGWPPVLWPWARHYWKPTPDDRIRELVKAGQLIAAAIDSLNAEASR